MWCLPVAPRPYPDELLSSWLGRVACRYGLRADELAGRFRRRPWTAARGADRRHGAERRQDRAVARVCRVDPERLRRLALTRRYPDRPRSWFGREGPECAAVARISAGVPRLFRRRSGGRARRVPAGGLEARRALRLLVAQEALSPTVAHMAAAGFRWLSPPRRARSACLRAVRAKSRRWGRGGRPAAQDQAVIEAVLYTERRIADRVDSGRSLGVEAAIAALWAPLDHPSAARPVLALWFEEPAGDALRGPACGRRAGAARRADFLAGRDLAALQDVYGAELMIDGATPAAVRLARRAARGSSPLRSAAAGRTVPRGSSARAPGGRLPRMAREILAHPEKWIAAAGCQGGRARASGAA